MRSLYKNSDSAARHYHRRRHPRQTTATGCSKAGTARGFGTSSVSLFFPREVGCDGWWSRVAEPRFSDTPLGVRLLLRRVWLLLANQPS